LLQTKQLETMRELLQRLKPNVRERLNLSHKDYPVTCEFIEKSMLYKVSYIELTIVEATDLLRMTTGRELSHNSINELFEEN